MKINTKSEWFSLVILIVFVAAIFGIVQIVKNYQTTRYCQSLAQQERGGCKVSAKDCLSPAKQYVLCSELHP